VATLVGQETLSRGSKNQNDILLFLERAFKEGVWGMSSNFSSVEWTRTLDTETVNLLKLVAEMNGLYKVHLRDEGKDFLPAIASVLNLIRRSGARTVISHFKGIGKSAWRDFSKALAMIETSRRDEISVAFDVFPYLRTGSRLVSFLPQWARSGDSQEILERLNNPDTAQKIIAELKSFTIHPDRVMIASAKRDKTIVGKTLEELSSASDLSLEEIMVEILKINQLNVTVFGKTVNGKHLLESLKAPESFISTDGAGYNLASKKTRDLAHPRSFGTYPRFFGKIAPLAKIPVGNAIAQATSKPASQLGLVKRGQIKKDFIADLALFHPEEFKDHSTYKNPYRYSTGMKYVILGGDVALSDGKVESKRFGIVLRKS